MSFKLLQPLVFISFLCVEARGFQNITQDTLIVSFSPAGDFQPFAVPIDSVIDRRGEPGTAVGRYEKNNYGFIPVDLLVRSEKPVADEITQSLKISPLAEKSPRLVLAVDEFNIGKKTNTKLYPHYVLNSSIQLYAKNGQDEPEYLGTLLYECTSRKPLFKNNLKNGFESAIGKWQREFYDDLSHISNENSLENLRKLENFRSGRYSGKLFNMYSGFDFFAGNHDWLVDGEICFSHREARRWFYRSGYNIRYRRAKDHDSIELGISDDCLFYRLDEKTVLRGKSQIFLGINRWDDIAERNHKVYDALMFDYSLGQSLIYNPLDRRSVTVGVGLLEDLYYVYKDGFRLQFALSLHLGVKL